MLKWPMYYYGILFVGFALLGKAKAIVFRFIIECIVSSLLDFGS